LLTFYFAHPFVAIAGSVLLLYCPPLLDILPMYVTFLFLTPIVLTAATPISRSLSRKPAPSTFLPGRRFGWSACGSGRGRPSGKRRSPGSPPGWPASAESFASSSSACASAGSGRPQLTAQALGVKLDKWQIGPLRVLNLVAFTLFAYWMRKYVLKFIAVEPFLTLGRASLHVFCAHIVFVFAGLTMLYGDLNSDGLDQLHGIPAIALLACTFASLLWLASNEVRKKRAEKEKRKAEELLARQNAEPPAELVRSGT
jgi:hypothetical protein